jgi:UDP:flavonoid glycosyltransferase YjiC (YdhE family)
MHCNGYVSTAGFESVCEAICLGKPILLIPVNQQLEQANNAKDALKTGNCMQETSFELDNFMTFIEKDFTNESFRTWAKSAPKLFLEQLGL